MVMSVPGIFILGRVSIMLQYLHLAFIHFFADIGWCVGDSFLDKYLFQVGGCLYAHRVVGSCSI